MSTCSVTFFSFGTLIPNLTLLIHMHNELAISFLLFPQSGFNFLLLYYLFHSQPLALTNTLFQSSFPVPLFPHPAIQAATIFNLTSHPIPYTLCPRAIPWSPLPPNATFNLLIYEQVGVFFPDFLGPARKLRPNTHERKDL